MQALIGVIAVISVVGILAYLIAFMVLVANH